MIPQTFYWLSSTFDKLLRTSKLSREMRKVLLILFVVILFVQILMVTNMLLVVALLRVVLHN
jgi:hypothetical protein